MLSLKGLSPHIKKKSPVGVCSTWFVDLTCSEEQILALKNGSLVFRGHVVIEPAGTVC